MPNILLQDRRTFETSHADKNRRSDLSQLPIKGLFPNLLITGDSCEVRTSLMDLADFLKRNDYSGDVAVRFQFSDATGKRKYKSGKFSVNVDEVLKRMHPTET